MTTVKAIKCPKCKETIFSRALHDFHSCSCKTVSIDGGFDYTRVLFSPIMRKPPEIFEIEVEQTPMELYEDWNTQTDKFGIIQKK